LSYYPREDGAVLPTPRERPYTLPYGKKGGGVTTVDWWFVDPEGGGERGKKEQ